LETLQGVFTTATATATATAPAPAPATSVAATTAHIRLDTREHVK